MGKPPTAPRTDKGQDNMSKTAKSNRKAKMVIRKELVEASTQEWNEWRVYLGKPKDGMAIASFKTEKEANAFVRKAA